MNPKNEFGSNPGPEVPSKRASEGAIAAYPNLQSEKVRPALGPQRVIGNQPTMPAAIAAYPANMAAYTEAVNEFTKSAIAFMEHLPLLSKARNAYDNAMKASGEIRKILDAGDEDLRALMAQLVQAVNKPVPEKKKPELAKLEDIRAGEEGIGSTKAFS